MAVRRPSADRAFSIPCAPPRRWPFAAHCHVLHLWRIMQFTPLAPNRRSPQYEKLAHDERRAPPRDEEAAKPTESNGDGHVPATTLPISSDLASPGVRAAAPAAPAENLLTFASVMKTGAVRCLQLDTEALISCREGLKSWCVAPPPRQLSIGKLTAIPAPLTRPSRTVAGSLALAVAQVLRGALSDLFVAAWPAHHHKTDGHTRARMSPTLSGLAGSPFDAVRCRVRRSMEFGSIMMWFFIADRTSALVPEEKEYVRDRFAFVFLALILVAGWTSTAKVKTAVLLNRQQTEEWKGWMQARTAAAPSCHAKPLSGKRTQIFYASPMHATDGRAPSHDPQTCYQSLALATTH